MSGRCFVISLSAPRRTFSMLSSWTDDPSWPITEKCFCYTWRNLGILNQCSTDVLGRMKSKLKFWLSLGALLFSLLKFLHCTNILYTVWTAVINDDCNAEKCLSEYFETIVVISLVGLLSFLVYGVSMVSERETFRDKNCKPFMFQSRQSFVGLWLVVHVILLGYGLMVQYEIRFGANSREYSPSSVIYKSLEMSELRGNLGLILLSSTRVCFQLSTWSHSTSSAD